MNGESPYPTGNPAPDGIILWWLPVGSGAPTRLPQIISQWWEGIQAWRGKRPPRQLVHAALEVYTNGRRFVIEMGPEWSYPYRLHKGVVARGPVVFRALGCIGLFRYEVRCWEDGELSARSWVMGGPVTVSRDADVAKSMLGHIADVPVMTWGRSVQPVGDMWNSNSLVSWLLVMTGIDVADLTPPGGRRAPGWAAGISMARQRNRAN